MMFICKKLLKKFNTLTTIAFDYLIIILFLYNILSHIHSE